MKDSRIKSKSIEVKQGVFPGQSKELKVEQKNEVTLLKEKIASLEAINKGLMKALKVTDKTPIICRNIRKEMKAMDSKNALNRVLTSTVDEILAYEKENGLNKGLKLYGYNSDDLAAFIKKCK